MPFIKKYHSDGKYVFWPDLTSSHYANTVLKFLNDNNVKFVQKADNPANVPKVRPIEEFWAHLKKKVYEGDWQAKNLDQLKDRIKKTLKNIDKDAVQNAYSSVRQRLDNVRRHGIESL